VRHARYAISFELKIEQRAMRSKWEHLVSFEQSDEEHKHRSRNPESDETQKRGKNISFLYSTASFTFFNKRTRKNVLDT